MFLCQTEKQYPAAINVLLGLVLCSGQAKTEKHYIDAKALEEKDNHNDIINANADTQTSTHIHTYRWTQLWNDFIFHPLAIPPQQQGHKKKMSKKAGSTSCTRGTLFQFARGAFSGGALDEGGGGGIDEKKLHPIISKIATKLSWC